MLRHFSYVAAAVGFLGLVSGIAGLVQANAVYDSVRLSGVSIARAGTPVDQGAPGAQGPWPTASGRCLTPTHSVTSVGLTAGNCPSSQLSGRKFIQLCNSAENAGTPKIKIRIDGTNPVMGTSNVGDVLLIGDCATYWIPSTVTPKCISDTAATAVTADECIQ